MSIYSLKHDPLQERSAGEIARFSRKDAETWLRLAALDRSREYQRVLMDLVFNPAELRTDPAILTRQMEVFPKLVEAGFIPDGLVLLASSRRMIGEWFESPEMQSCILRFLLTSVNDVNEAGWGASSMGYAAYLPSIGYIPGATHMVAHAAHQMLVHMGCHSTPSPKWTRSSSRTAPPPASEFIRRIRLNKAALLIDNKFGMFPR